MFAIKIEKSDSTMTESCCGERSKIVPKKSKNSR